jgi:hypothetical protein
MIIIEAKVILANLLRNKEKVTIRNLKGIRKKLETSIKGLYIDITMTSIIIAVETNNNMFELDDNIIYRCKNSEKNFKDDYLEDCFNWRIPEKIKDKVLEILRDSNV